MIFISDSLHKQLGHTLNCWHQGSQEVFPSFDKTSKKKQENVSQIFKKRSDDIKSDSEIEYILNRKLNYQSIASESVLKEWFNVYKSVNYHFVLITANCRMLIAKIEIMTCYDSWYTI